MKERENIMSIMPDEREHELLDMCKVTKNWFEMNSYVVLDKKSEENAILGRITTISDSLKPFLENARQEVAKRLEQNRYEEAITFVHEALKKAEKLFCATDDAKTAKIMLCRRLGFIYEHWATHGELSKLPHGNERRTISFLHAARWYMLGDLEIDYISDFGMRISECLGGAKIPNLQLLALKKTFNSDNFTIIDSDFPIQDLTRRAVKSVSTTEEVPFGKKAKVYSIPVDRLPNSRDN